MPSRIWILWALFLIRGTFYSAMMPLWEGWDEYAHLAWLQHWNDQGSLPRVTGRVSREIDESMRLAPLPRELRWIGAPYLTHEEWWALPATEREARTRELAALRPSLAHQPQMPLNRPPLVFYEAQQPPLYYWMAAAVMRPVEGWSLSERVRLIRLFSVLLTSIAIPFAFLAARNLLRDDGAALCCAALLAVAPGLAIDSAHVSNDSLAIALAAVFLWLMTRQDWSWLPTGTVLGLALLAKAHMLFLIPILVVVWFRRSRKDLGLALLLGSGIGLWWYVRNVILGDPFTGWLDSVGIERLTASLVQLLRTGKWLNGIGTIAKSFTWFGGWSFLTLRSWAYSALEVVAVGGMLSGIVRRRAQVRIPLVFSISFVLATAGGALAYNAAQGIPGLPGWYLWPAGGAMAILIVAGLGRYSLLFAAMLGAADILGVVTRMAPYYAGLAARDHGSILQLPEALSRLHVPEWFAALWLIATAAIPFLMFQGRAKTRM